MKSSIEIFASKSILFKNFTRFENFSIVYYFLLNEFQKKKIKRDFYRKFFMKNEVNEIQHAFTAISINSIIMRILPRINFSHVK